ncbi:hypothetical protein MJO28_014525 [Puccinia striiformis f. sp. tritici]|uniref:Uncharacterized protein n=1 Tax=Puccinia striiformis f. sp. tritici TaxID=168172 RepID=A0ACC0DUY9_9BASI|nr:hypothetical protein Pst134EB_027541 [Puccinia striiformis f. sp. tritici]KAI7938946.1 hypothetical protein MJO28_014525 [Puccinia striiformis f. sp. tritici]
MRSEGDQASIPTDGAQAISVQVESSRRRIQELSEALKEEQSKLERLEALERTLQTFSQPQSNISLESQTEEDPNNNGGGGPKRKAYQAVRPEVKELVIQNVFDKGMTQRKVSESFGLSERTVRRIIKAEKNIHSGQEPVPKRRRGAKTKLTGEIMTELLFKLERQPTMTLSDMKRYVSDVHSVTCTPQSISRMLSSMDVNWKTTVEIPAHWNQLNILQERHDFVVRRAIDVDKELIYVGDTGFDLNFNRSQDPSCSDQGATLSLVPRTSQATLIGAMTTNGYVYHEIINPDGKRVTGLTRADYEEFLVRLTEKVDTKRSVVIVERSKLTQSDDIAPLDGRLGVHYKEPDSLELLLNTTTHHPTLLDHNIPKIEIDYLPPCSAFLSPLEISFVDLKNHVKDLNEPPIQERNQLILRINHAIHSLFGLPKPQNLFNFIAKEIYPNCFNMVPISGPIIKHPDCPNRTIHPQ